MKQQTLDASSDEMTQHAAGWARPLAFLLVVIGLALCLRFLPMTEWTNRFLLWVKSLGPAGPVALGAGYVIACVIMVPGTILTIGAGVLFGMIIGTITVSISATIGATVAFLIGRYVARDTLARWIARDPRFQAIDRAVAKGGWKIVGLVRLSPIFPFNLINYAFGLTHIPLPQYVAATWLGMIPGTILYVYIGAVAGDLAKLGGQRRALTSLEWIFYGVGLLFTVIATLYVTRIAHRALQQAMEEARNPHPRNPLQ